MTNSIEDYMNQVELLKQALNFYGNKENYEVNHPVNGKLFSSVEMDSGAQARFALERLEKTELLNKEMEDDFVKNVTEAIEAEDTQENIFKLLEEIKKVGESQE